MSHSESPYPRLRRRNAVMGALHAAQAVAILALGNGFALPVTADYMAGPPGSGLSARTTLFQVDFSIGVATFLLLSAAAHLLLVTPWGFKRYQAVLAERRNPMRWIEYSLSSSVMIVLIAMLTGISDVAALIALFGVNAAMIGFGWVMENNEKPGSPAWLAFVLGSAAGAVPWIAISVYLFSPGGPAGAKPPTFVYAIFLSLLLFFNTFAVNMFLQYRQRGRWQDYLFGERVYIWLSLIAKSLLAWQVFAGTLAPTG